jgi:hypothetical protein
MLGVHRWHDPMPVHAKNTPSSIGHRCGEGFERVKRIELSMLVPLDEGIDMTVRTMLIRLARVCVLRCCIDRRWVS